MIGQRVGDIGGREPLQPLFVADAEADRRTVECPEQAPRVSHTADGLGRLGIVEVGTDRLRTDLNVLLDRQRNDPGAEIACDGHAFVDRGRRLFTGLPNEGQKHVLDWHPRSPGRTANIHVASSPTRMSPPMRTNL